MTKVRHGRQGARFLCARLLQIELVQGPRRGCTMVGVVEDVSEGGLCVSLDVEMQPGMEVMLHEADGGVRGQVRQRT